MTNPDDPRTPQERAYDGTESWTTDDSASRATDDSASRARDEDPTQAWSRQDQPTEHLGRLGADLGLTRVEQQAAR